MNRVTTYIQQSWRELRKVVWPSRKQAIQYTFAVIVFAIVLGAFVGLLDLLYTSVIQKLILKT